MHHGILVSRQDDQFLLTVSIFRRGHYLSSHMRKGVAILHTWSKRALTANRSIGSLLAVQLRSNVSGAFVPAQHAALCFCNKKIPAEPMKERMKMVTSISSTSEVSWPRLRRQSRPDRAPFSSPITAAAMPRSTRTGASFRFLF